ncbi:hypothetical protein Tco_1239810, partial [Tanacetum coccineum]
RAELELLLADGDGGDANVKAAMRRPARKTEPTITRVTTSIAKSHASLEEEDSGFRLSSVG